MGDEVLKSIGIMALCGIGVLITILSIAGIRHFTMSEANAEPVTTEIPEYVAKCSKTSFNRSSCIEFTIYRITRN